MLLQEIVSTLDVHLLAIGRRRLGVNWNFENVNSPYNRLIYVLEGEGRISHQGHTYRVGRGGLHLVPCYVTADYASESERLELCYLHFTSRAFGGLDVCRVQEYEYERPAREVDRFFFHELLRLNPGRELPVLDPAVRRYRIFHDETQKGYHGIDPRLHMENQAYVSLLLAPFLETGTARGTTKLESRRLYDFACYVEANLHRPFGLKDVSDALGITPNYLSDWLFKVLRIRPIEYINRRKIEEAQLLLISSDVSIKEIALRLGFTPSYFARVFKRQLGVSASRYREINR